eukprot:TRINITY_DN4576_c0_g1_i5.p1 TRINITY_DN4576_c0_g1~~TRINITY_DN4576_c0_g1_i5.p1  ORF type:complete len:265 (-),score=30.49 TRINITY_DN4576_c0_g1_i5:90-884(-)
MCIRDSPGKKKCPHCGALSGVRSFKCSNAQCTKPFYSDAELQAMPGSQKPSMKANALTTFKVVPPRMPQGSLPGCSKFKLEAPKVPDPVGEDHIISGDGLTVIPAIQNQQQGLMNCVQVTIFQDCSQRADFAPQDTVHVPVPVRPKKRSLIASGSPGKKKCPACGSLSGVRALKCSTCHKPFYTDDELLAMPKLGKARRLHVGKSKPAELDHLGDHGGLGHHGLTTTLPTALPTILPTEMMPVLNQDVPSPYEQHPPDSVTVQL